MTPTQLAAIQQAIANFKAATQAQIPSALTMTVSLNLTGDGSYSINYQFPSVVSGKVNTSVFSGPMAELPAAA